MFEWLNNEGASFKHHIPGETNYLTRLKQRGGNDGSESNRPFPNNQNFVGESILSEELRNEVYKRVVTQKKSVRVVSVELGIDMKRIAAVVRLVELETRQRKQVRLFSVLLAFFFPLSLFFLLGFASTLHAYDESQKID